MRFSFARVVVKFIIILFQKNISKNFIEKRRLSLGLCWIQSKIFVFLWLFVLFYWLLMAMERRKYIFNSSIWNKSFQQDGDWADLDDDLLLIFCTIQITKVTKSFFVSENFLSIELNLNSNIFEYFTFKRVLSHIRLLSEFFVQN